MEDATVRMRRPGSCVANHRGTETGGNRELGRGAGRIVFSYSQFNQSVPRVLVPADRLDEARAIVARPIPKEIVEQSKMQLPEFDLPVCPKCGAGASCRAPAARTPAVLAARVAGPRAALAGAPPGRTGQSPHPAVAPLVAWASAQIAWARCTPADTTPPRRLASSRYASRHRSSSSSAAIPLSCLAMPRAAALAATARTTARILLTS